MTDKLDTAAIRAQMEALAGFTPGPWDTETDLPYNTMPRVSGADGSLICECGNVSTDQDQWESDARLIAAAPDMRETIIALCDALDELRADNDRLRKAAGVVSAVLQSERTRLGGQPFTGNWSIPQIGFRGTVDDALDMADAALAQKGGE